MKFVGINKYKKLGWIATFFDNIYKSVILLISNTKNYFYCLKTKAYTLYSKPSFPSSVKIEMEV